jgi:hypothetical protein
MTAVENKMTRAPRSIIYSDTIQVFVQHCAGFLSARESGWRLVSTILVSHT